MSAKILGFGFWEVFFGFGPNFERIIKKEEQI